jgi:hypothetical protein
MTSGGNDARLMLVNFARLALRLGASFGGEGDLIDAEDLLAEPVGVEELLEGEKQFSTDVLPSGDCKPSSQLVHAVAPCDAE